MSVTLRFPMYLCLLLLGVFCAQAPAQTNFVLTPQGGEFLVIGALPGDQVWPSLSLSSSAGCIAWEGMMPKRTYQAIGAAMLNNDFTGQEIFRVNRTTATAARIPTMPKVQLLANNDTIFVWGSAISGTPAIYARWARGAKNSDEYGTNFYSGDVRVNTYAATPQIEPAVAALPDGSAMVVWSSWAQDGSMFGVYGRRMEENHTGAGKQFLINQYTSYNQHHPAITALNNGTFVVAWVSEQEISTNSVGVYARIFSDDGTPQSDEIAVNSTNYPCGNPAVAPTLDGGFTVVWAEKDTLIQTNGWDIWGRAFTASGAPETSDFRVNTFLYGDQYQPKIATGSTGSMVVWTSLGEDGSREGVYGRFLTGGTQPVGGEIQVNTTTISQQMHQDVAWGGSGQFLVVWAGFNGESGFDLYGQAYTVTSQ